MKEQGKIPVGKVQRATKFVVAGAKIGGNYLKYQGQRLFDSDQARADLDQDNAKAIYSSLSELKGSALKVAQMLSLDTGLLPQAYTDQFAQAQYKAPPLSYPLVVRSFKRELGQEPLELFDRFEPKAVAAASIGQVHRAEKNGVVYAVKLQYPGVADSIASDLKLVRPIAMSMFNLNASDLDHYLGEVEERLLEECDYTLELERSLRLSALCADLEGVEFSRPERALSSGKILTMSWLEGMHMDEFLKTSPSQAVRDSIGQSIWDFYDRQIHELREVHADPHPGNFLFQPDGRVGVLDFGCVKTLTPSFYKSYFRLILPDSTANDTAYRQLMYDLRYLLPEDKPADADYYLERIKALNGLLGLPFQSAEFDFGDADYFQKIYALSESLSKDKRLRSANGARGPKDAIYINRTYFGLYTLLHQLKAKVNVTDRTSLLRAGLNAAAV
ncbi:phosphotransferase [bacterium]|nr:phosphotransferase [bacterium]